MVPRCIVETDGLESFIQLGEYEVRSDGLWRTEFERAPLVQRAWVLQERPLAPRVVHFDTRNVLWESLELEAWETYTNGLRFEYSPRRVEGIDGAVDGNKA